MPNQLHLVALVRHTAVALSLTTTALWSHSALAGDIEVSDEPLETNDRGRLTPASRKATVGQLQSLPGEDVWEIHLWADLDGGAPGPLYVQFWDKFQGKDVKVPWSHEYSDYDGSETVTLDFTLDGNVGFNKGHTYRIRIVQVGRKGNDIVLAKGAKVKLVFQEAPDEAEGDTGETGATGTEPSAQDIADGLVGPDEEAGPPEVESPGRKRGCSMGTRPTSVFSGLAVLLAVAGAGRRRRIALR